MFPLASFMSRMTGIASTSVSFIVNLIAAACARATTRTVVNGGLIESVAINTAAISDGSLDVDDSGTNVMWPSEDFTDPEWTKIRSSAIADQTVAPDGNATADKFIMDATAANNHQLQYFEAATTTNDYTLSLFVKAAELSWISIRFSSASGVFANEDVYFDVGNCVVGTSTVGNAGIEDFGNGWCRLFATSTALATATARYDIFLAEGDGDVTLDGDSTSGVYVWGADLKQESSLSSYIPTITASVTRAADICTVPVSGVHSITKGAERLQFIPAATGQVNKYLRSFFVDATHRIDLYINATQVIAFYVDGANTSSAAFTYSHLATVPMFADIYWDSVLNELGVRADAVSGDVDAKVFQTGTFAGMTALPATSDIGNKDGADIARGLFVTAVDYASKEAASW